MLRSYNESRLGTGKTRKIIGYLTEAEFEVALETKERKRRRRRSSSPVVDGVPDLMTMMLCRVAVDVAPDERLHKCDEVDLTPAVVDVVMLTIRRDAPMEYAVEMFAKLGLGYLFVVDGDPGQLCGVVTKKHLLDWLHEKRKASNDHQD